MRVERIESAARLALLAGLTLKLHDRINHQTRIIAQLCGVNIRTIQRDIKGLPAYQARLAELKSKYQEVLDNA